MANHCEFFTARSSNFYPTNNMYNKSNFTAGAVRIDANLPGTSAACTICL